MYYFEGQFDINKIQEQCKKHFLSLKNGKSAYDIAVSIYMSLGKDEKTARMMVDCIKKLIAEYHQNLRISTSEMVRRKLDDEIDGVDSVEKRCEIYYRALIIIGAYEILCSGDEDAEERAEDFLCENQDFYLKKDDDPIKKEQELRSAVEEALQKASFPIDKLESFFVKVDLTYAELDAQAVFANFGEESADLKLILCTQAYVNFMSGYCDNKSPALSLEEIVNAVCAGVDLNAISNENDPSVAQQILEKILRLLYCVLVLAAFAIIPGMLFITFTFLMSIPWAIACLIGCFILFWMWDKEYAEILKYVGLRVQEIADIVIHGIYSLFEWACEKIAAGAKFVIDWIRKIFFPGPPPSGSGAGNCVTDESELFINRESKAVEYEEIEENDRDGDKTPIYI